jgi:transcriptional regulator with XRE-family HTH domain
MVKKRQRQSEFGARLRSLREARGWSQSELAHYAHLTSQAVCRLESGVSRAPSLMTARALAGVFEIPLENLLAETLSRA